MHDNSRDVAIGLLQWMFILKKPVGLLINIWHTSTACALMEMIILEPDVHES